MMRPTILVCSIVLAACTRGSGQRNAGADSAASVAPDVEMGDTASSNQPVVREGASDSAVALIEGYIERFGHTRTEVHAVLGQPDSASTRATQNIHDSTVTDTVVTLYYPKLTVGLFVFPYGNGGFVTSLEVTGARPDIPFGLGVGAPCAKVRTVLGAPTQEDSLGHRVRLSYGGPGSDPRDIRGPDEIRFECEAGAVSRIQWVPYVD